ncbi:hypothetical protein, partial [Xanthomonas euvesicatoria]|uniref:hypothetical protein n=1 Tax=Xanthomonas euvesicatoria TaxID=456327 RepID=UPI001C455D29
MSRNNTHAPAAENGTEVNIIDTSASAQRARLLAALRRGPVTTLDVNADLNLTHFSLDRRSKSDPPGVLF